MWEDVYMFKNSKRVSCVLLFAFWMQATVAFAGTEPTAVKDIKDTYRHHVVFDLDNDIGKCFGGQIVEMENSDKKSVLRVDPGKTSKMLFDKETDDSAVDIFSFDFKTSSDQTSVYFELIDADAPVKSDAKSDFENEAQYYDRYGRVLWFQKKDMKVFATMDYADLFKMTDMDPGNWHHMDLVVDYNQPDHGRVFYYLDGKLLTMPAYINKWIGVEGERSGGAANFNAITDLLESFKICEGIRAINTGSTGNLELSNVKFFRMKNYGERIDKDYVQGYPEHIESWITLSNERLGSNFAGKNIKYTVKVSNPYNKRAELTFVSTVYNEEKKQEYMVTKTVSLDSGETTAVPIEFSVSNYGFYTIKTTGTDNLGGNGINVENGFSVFAKSDTVNPHSLLASNNMTFYGIAEYERGLDLYSEAGFGGTRDSITWASFEKKKGEYEFRDYQKKIVVKTAENNMVNFMLLAYDNEKAGYAGSPPQTAESIKGYANYAMNLAKSMKEVLPKGAKMEFEVWNEYDHKPFNRDGASVENYIEMLKQTYSAIKWVDSNAKVWGGGGGLTYEWLDEFMKLGGYKYCDGLTFHPYAATSEAIVSYEKFLKHREVLKKYGQEDFPVCLSEIGWTSDVDDVQARRLVQFAIMIDGEVDSSIYYRHYMDQQNSVAENFFGILGPAHYTKSYPKEPITARASFLALAAFNKILNGATEKIKLNPEDEKITAYSFKAQDGDRIVACWSNYSIETQETVYTDAKVLKIYDIYGNEQEYVPVDGKVSIQLGAKPKYIKGDFADIKFSANAFSSIDKIDVDVPKNDEFSLHLSKQFDDDVQIDVDLPSNITIKSNSGYDMQNKATLRFATAGNAVDDSVIVVSVKKDGKKVAEHRVNINYCDSIVSDVTASYFRSGKWQYKVELVNRKETGEMSGVLLVNSPTQILDNEKKLTFKNIRPKEKRTFYINIPNSVIDVKNYFSADIILDDGETYKLEDTIYTSAIVYTETPPMIDGKIDSNEWFKNAPVKLKYNSQAQEITDWGGVFDVGGNVYCMYDKDNFYIAGEITDNILGDNDEQKRIWANDSIQFAFAPVNEKGKPYTEYGIGIVNGETKFERYSFVVVDTGVLGVTDKEGYEGIDVKINRDEEKMINYYEAKIPWKMIYGDTVNIMACDGLYFSLLVNDNDGNGRRGWIEYCPGIGKEKNPAQFIYTPFAKKNVFRYNR